MRVAIVYDRVNKYGGAEKVIIALKEIYPNAELFSPIYHQKKASWSKIFDLVHTSLLNKIRFVRDKHEHVSYLLPLFIELFDFKGYDLVISVTSEFSKGIITPVTTKHVSIILTPTRYLWSHYDEYFKNRLLRLFSYPATKYLRFWDKIAANRPDKIIAISTDVQKRIKSYYRRNSKLIFPPVDINKYYPRKHDSYYLYVGRLVSYKKVDILINAFNLLGRKLVVVGEGHDESRLRKMAGNNITFTGFVDEEKLVEIYSKAKAFIQVQREDFGIAMVEAQASGVPIIAYDKGGSKDIVVNGKTGLFFRTQSPKAIVDAVIQFDKMNFSTIDIVENAKKFDKKIFQRKIKELCNG